MTVAVLAVLSIGATQGGCQSMMTRTVQQGVERSAETATMCRGVLPGADRALGDPSTSAKLLETTDLFNLATRFKARFDPTVVFAEQEEILSENPFTSPSDLKTAFGDLLTSAKKVKEGGKALGQTLFGDSERVWASDLQYGESKNRAVEKINEGVAKAKTAAGDLVSELRELNSAYDRFEQALRAARARGGFEDPKELDAIASVRGFQNIVAQMLPAVEAAAAGDARKLLSLMTARELGFASRVAFRLVMASVKAVDRQLAALDENLSGAVGAYLVVADAELEPIVAATGCELGCTLGHALLSMGVSPEAVTAEACSSLYSASSESNDLKLLGTLTPDLYVGLVKGFQQACKVDKTKSSIAQLASATKEGADASLRAEWTSTLSFAQANARREPQTDERAAERREAHVRWWLTSSSLTDKPPASTPAPENGNENAGPNASGWGLIQLAGAVEHLSAAVAAQTRAITAPPVPPEPKSNEELRELMKRLAEVQTAL